MKRITILMIIILIIIAVFVLIFLNQKPRGLSYEDNSQSVVVIDQKTQLFIDFNNFVKNEQTEFQKEFNVLQRSKIDIIGEKEKEELFKNGNEEVINTGGVCFVSGFQDASQNFEDIGFILINLDIWKKLSNEDKKALIYHELVHCGLDFPEHVENTDEVITKLNDRPTYLSNGEKFNCPISIMSTSLFSPEQKTCIRDNLPYYVEDIHIRTGK